MMHLREGDSKIYPLKWQKELPLIQRSSKIFYTNLRQFSSDHLEGVGRMAYSDLDDVDYLVEDNIMDEFAYHRRWKRPMVEWHIGGAS